MNLTKIAKFISVVVTIAGLLVIGGWIFDITFLKSILPHWPSMKFGAAICFVFSGAIIYSIAQIKQGSISLAQIILPISCLIIILIMVTLFISVIVGIETGIEKFFIKEAPGALHTSMPGKPSVGTMVGFIAIAFTGLLTMFYSSEISFFSPLKGKLCVLGVFVTLIGAFALLGFILNLPALYYTWPGFSNAMALNTAFLFVLLGMSLIILSRERAMS